MLSPVLPTDYVSILHPPRINSSSITKCIQTELTSQSIQEYECQTSSDLELKNNKIDELNRVRRTFTLTIDKQIFSINISYVKNVLIFFFIYI